MVILVEKRNGRERRDGSVECIEGGGWIGFWRDW